MEKQKFLKILAGACLTMAVSTTLVGCSNPIKITDGVNEANYTVNFDVEDSLKEFIENADSFYKDQIELNEEIEKYLDFQQDNIYELKSYFIAKYEDALICLRENNYSFVYKVKDIDAFGLAKTTQIKKYAKKYGSDNKSLEIRLQTESYDASGNVEESSKWDRLYKIEKQVSGNILETNVYEYNLLSQNKTYNKIENFIDPSDALSYLNYHGFIDNDDFIISRKILDDGKERIVLYLAQDSFVQNISLVFDKDKIIELSTETFSQATNGHTSGNILTSSKNTYKISYEIDDSLFIDVSDYTLNQD